MREKYKSCFQLQLKFSSLDAEKIIYCIEGVLSELSKLLITFAVALQLGYADKIFISYNQCAVTVEDYTFHITSLVLLEPLPYRNLI